MAACKNATRVKITVTNRDNTWFKGDAFDSLRGTRTLAPVTVPSSSTVSPPITLPGLSRSPPGSVTVVDNVAKMASADNDCTTVALLPKYSPTVVNAHSVVPAR